MDDVYARIIAPASVRSSERAALWLYAWTIQQRSMRQFTVDDDVSGN